jgi:hypothetical protein
MREAVSAEDTVVSTPGGEPTFSRSRRGRRTRTANISPLQLIGDKSAVLARWICGMGSTLTGLVQPD